VHLAWFTSAVQSEGPGKLGRLRGRGKKQVSQLRRGDVVAVEAGEVIPGDGIVIEGIATVDESAVTGESAPVIRESGGDRSDVMGGTRVISHRIVVKLTQDCTGR
jgi:potassium-transporting ATPase ATP-binding subunit